MYSDIARYKIDRTAMLLAHLWQQDIVSGDDGVLCQRQAPNDRSSPWWGWYWGGLLLPSLGSWMGVSQPSLLIHTSPAETQLVI